MIFVEILREARGARARAMAVACLIAVPALSRDGGASLLERRAIVRRYG